MSAGPTPRVGVVIGSVGVDARWWLDAASQLDAAGYPSAWTWDHFIGKGDRTVPVVEAWTVLAAAAAITRQLELGTFVTNVMNRHPAVLARMAATVQVISRGRLTVGIGIGGHAAEHRAYGMPFPEPAARAARLESAVGVLRALWSGGPVSRSDGHARLDDAVAFPRPDPVPAILIGAGTPAGVRLAARIGDGWAAEAAGFDPLLPRYLDALRSAGRDRRDVRIVVGIGGGRSGVDALAGSPWLVDPATERARWAAAGADDVLLTVRTDHDVLELVRAAPAILEPG